MAKYSVVGGMIAVAAAGTINAFAQQRPDDDGPGNRPNNSVPVPTSGNQPVYYPSAVPAVQGGPSPYVQLPGGSWQSANNLPRYGANSPLVNSYSVSVPPYSVGIPPMGPDSNLSPEDLQKRYENRKAAQDAIAKLRSQDSSESDKKTARETIATFLTEEFDRDSKHRSKQLEHLEEQVSKLRKQMEKREQSKSKIIELKLQTLENEAEGLGFPDSGFTSVGPNDWQPTPFPQTGNFPPATTYYTQGNAFPVPPGSPSAPSVPAGPNRAPRRSGPEPR